MSHHRRQGSQGLVLVWILRNRKQQRQQQHFGEVAATKYGVLACQKIYRDGPVYVITALVFSHIEWQNVQFLSMCIITLHCAPEESRSLSFSALVQLTEEH